MVATLLIAKVMTTASESDPAEVFVSVISKPFVNEEATLTVYAEPDPPEERWAVIASVMQTVLFTVNVTDAPAASASAVVVILPQGLFNVTAVLLLVACVTVPPAPAP